MTTRNVEEIRQKNLQDNQLFLKELCMNHVRNDFLKTAHSIVSKDETKKRLYIKYEKVERITRYSLKVKSGEIQPFIPQWQQKINKKKKHCPSKWTLFYKNNANPYQHTYKQRIRN